MLRYVIKRVLLIIPTMLIVSLFVFLLVNITAADPGRLKLGTMATQEQVDAVNHELGYDRPVLVRYGTWVWDAFHGDFGKTWYTNRPVFDELKARLPYTAKLTFLGIVSAIIVGVPLGIWCAVKRNSIADYTLSTAAMFMAAMPVFWISLLLLLTFSLKLGWFPSSGVKMGWKSWVLPVFPLTIGYGAGYIRFTRTAMLDNIFQDYVRTARSKGCSEQSVIWKHAFRNSMMTLTTITGLSVAGLMGGAFVLESVFSIPGLGVWGVNSITKKDVPAIMASLITIGTLFIIIMIIIDILYAFLDPRVRSMYGQSKRKIKKLYDVWVPTADEIAAMEDPVLPEDMVPEILKRGGQSNG